MKTVFTDRTANIIAEIRTRTCIDKIDTEVLEEILQEELVEYYNEALTYARSLEKAVDSAFDEGYALGYSEGYSEGHSEGYSDGYDDGEAMGGGDVQNHPTALRDHPRQSSLAAMPRPFQIDVLDAVDKRLQQDVRRNHA